MSNRFNPTPADRFTFGLRTGLLADRSACEDFDVTGAAERGMAFEALDQLGMEHLLGVS
uniref:Uncharacterized protein n=1 Tax=Streptomyces sp. NBC_00008 TaxID=2903610 RepID=A0AAU2W3G5_9ACTN